MPGKRAVLFDLGGVLIDWNPRHLYRSLFAREADMERFLAEVCDARWNWEIDAGKPFLEAVRERQLRFPQQAELIGYWWSRWPEMLAGEIPGTVALLERLKVLGVPLYALTNWSLETFAMTRERFPFLAWFERIVVSGEEGMAKPDPRFFRLAIERCALDPERTLFIDDNPENVAAAREQGLDAVRFTAAAPLARTLAERGLLD
jgi:2-haloacid dehalogenase